MKKPIFATIYDVLKDKQFRILLDESINEMTHERNQILRQFTDLDIQGIKQNTFTRLDLLGVFTVDFLIDEFRLIEESKSELSAIDRKFIMNMILDHIKRTVDFYK